MKAHARVYALIDTESKLTLNDKNMLWNTLTRASLMHMQKTVSLQHLYINKRNEKRCYCVLY